jgi:hypothetical protein
MFEVSKKEVFNNFLNSHLHLGLKVIEVRSGFMARFSNGYYFYDVSKNVIIKHFTQSIDYGYGRETPVEEDIFVVKRNMGCLQVENIEGKVEMTMRHKTEPMCLAA